MAETKKKSTAKKVASKKASKKNTAATTDKKDIKASNKSNTEKETKKVDAKKTNHVSNLINDTNNIWVIVSIVLAIIVVLLIISILIISTNNDKCIQEEELFNNNNLIQNNELAADIVKLITIEDSECINCQVDLFAEQVKTNLIPDLEYEKLDANSVEGAGFVKSLGANILPIYLFSENIQNIENWTELSYVFMPVEINNLKYFMLNPDFMPFEGKVFPNVETLDGAVVIGDENAPVTIYEFTDFECPYCAIADGNPEMVELFRQRIPDYEPPMPKVYEEYVNTGKVKVVFYNYPIASLHPNSMIMHSGAMCANEQNKFKEFSLKIWEDRANWADSTELETTPEERAEILKAYAKDLGLNEDDFAECLDSNKYEEEINSEIVYGQNLGVLGTPGFIINKYPLSGAQDFNTFKELIEAELAKE